MEMFAERLGKVERYAGHLEGHCDRRISLAIGSGTQGRRPRDDSVRGFPSALYAAT